MMRPASLLMVLWSALAFPAGATAAQYTITINNMTFGPAPKHLKVGDTINWKNEDIFRHTATDRNGAFDLILKPGSEATVTLKRAGQFKVYCRYHPGMTLQLSVAK